MDLSFFVLHGFIFVTLVCSGDPPCPSNIRSCYNCEVEGGCLQGEYINISEEECLTHLTSQETMWSVEYNYSSGGCRESNCEDIKILYREGKVIHRKTCDTECSSYTLRMVPEHRVSAGQNSAMDLTGPKNWECMAHCLSTTTSCMVAYQTTAERCIVYNECEDTCPLESNQVSWRVYTRTCGHPGCENLSSPGNCSLSINGTSVGETARFTCYTGFLISNTNTNSTTLVCQSDGTWSEETPICNIADCGEPAIPTNGFVNFTGTSYQHTATYRCKFTHLLSIGNATRICTSQGVWEGREPECELVNCRIPEYPTNGLVSMTGREYNDVATFSCNSGFVLVGNVSATCDLTGNWNIVLPSCELDNGTTTNSGTTAQMTTDQPSTTTASPSASQTTSILPPTSEPSTTTIPPTTPEPSTTTIPPTTSRVTTDSFTTEQPTSTLTYFSTTHLLTSSTQSSTTSSSLATAATTNPVTNLYIMPCICNYNKTFVNMTQEEIISQLIKDTRIDKKKTALAQSRLKSKYDSRVSSVTIGVSGIAILCTLAGVILCCDILTLYNRKCQPRKHTR